MDESTPVEDMTVDDLKAELAELDQPVGGNKHELQKRLAEARAAAGEDGEGDGDVIHVGPEASAADPSPAAKPVKPSRRSPVRDEAHMKNAPPDVTAPKPAPPAISEKDNMIRGLLIERAGYARAGEKDKVKLVDDQLKLYGYSEPKGRRAPGKSAT